jgi:hypothetical protein
MREKNGEKRMLSLRCAKSIEQELGYSGGQK